MSYSSRQSVLHTVIGQCPELSAYYAALPDYSGARSGLDTLEVELAGREQGLRHARHAFEARLASVIEAAATGEPLPDDLDTWAEPGETTTSIRVLTAAQNTLGSTWDMAARTGVPGGLRVLHNALTDAVATARALGSTVLDAERAISEGRVDDWQRLAVARETYVRCREAQRQLIASGLDDPRSYLGELGRWATFSNTGTLWPTWQQRRSGPHSPGEGWSYATTPPHLAPWPIDDSNAEFAWVISHREANPWIPTPTQLRDMLALQSNPPEPEDLITEDLNGDGASLTTSRSHRAAGLEEERRRRYNERLSFILGGSVGESPQRRFASNPPQTL